MVGTPKPREQPPCKTSKKVFEVGAQDAEIIMGYNQSIRGTWPSYQYQTTNPADQ
jgi:hypothetical protein